MGRTSPKPAAASRSCNSVPGVAGVRYLLSAFRNAFPDVQFTVEDQIAEGDKVVTRYTFRGTHQGNLFEIPPTGKTVAFPGISIYRMQNGKMKEAWVNYDVMGMMQQLGVVSASPLSTINYHFPSLNC